MEKVKLSEYVKGLKGNTLIDVNKLLESGFTEPIYMGEAKFACDDEMFSAHKDYDVLYVTGGAGECICVNIEE